MVSFEWRPGCGREDTLITPASFACRVRIFIVGPCVVAAQRVAAEEVAHVAPVFRVKWRHTAAHPDMSSTRPPMCSVGPHHVDGERAPRDDASAREATKAHDMFGLTAYFQQKMHPRRCAADHYQRCPVQECWRNQKRGLKADALRMLGITTSQNRQFRRKMDPQPGREEDFSSDEDG